MIVIKRTLNGSKSINIKEKKKKTKSNGREFESHQKSGNSADTTAAS